MANAGFDTTVRREKVKRFKRICVSVIVIAIIAALGIFVCSENLFFVKGIDVKNISEDEYLSAYNPYTDDEMLEGLEIKKESGLYDFDASVAVEKAKYNLPYIKEIKISRRWPSTVVAKVKFEKPTYYISVENNLYILSDNLKVLERTKDYEKIEIGSLILLECKGIHNCIVGEKLGIPEDIEEIIAEIDKHIEAFEVKKHISNINVSDMFNLSIMYGTRYNVKLGDAKNIETKIEFMKRVIESRTDDTSGGTIDVSDVDKKKAAYTKFV